jgi:hypothetical protein
MPAHSGWVREWRNTVELLIGANKQPVRPEKYWRLLDNFQLAPSGLAMTTRMAARPSSCLQRKPPHPFDCFAEASICV